MKQKVAFSERLLDRCLALNKLQVGKTPLQHRFDTVLDIAWPQPDFYVRQLFFQQCKYTGVWAMSPILTVCHDDRNSTTGRRAGAAACK